jgi:cytochrome c-type biogenesis protein CcmH
MKANPDDLQGWLMLARSYKSLGRYEEAVDAFTRAEKAINDDSDLLASYAETLALATGKGFKGKPRQLIERSLKVNPEHPYTLLLAGAAAMEAGERKLGVAYWEKLLPLVEPGSDMDKMLRQGIDKMKQGS